LRPEPQKYEMIRRAFSEMHPILQVVFFFSLLLTGTAVAMGVGLAALAAVTGNGLEATLNAASQPGNDWGKTVNIVLNSANQIIAFALAPLLFHWLFGGRLLTAFAPAGPSARPAIGWLLVAGVGALAMAPVLDLTYRLNRMLVEATPFGPLVAHYESAAEVITKALLTMPDTGSFIGTLITIALLPAVCEEIAFRGVLMPRLARYTGNVHVAVWVSAALFSAIHMQFFGFIPRMLIGAGLGYLTIHSGRLWPAIAAHFVNNGATVIAAFVFGEEWLEAGMDPMTPWEQDDFVLAAGSVVVFALIWAWWRRRPRTFPAAGEAYCEAVSR
jgi:membrane protease YdiL (CAAX protease family)